MGFAPRAEAATGRVLARVCAALATIGGALLVALAVVTVASVLGRSMGWAGLGPITGDFELVEAGCAIAIFLFLPYCQMRRGHVTVDVVARLLPGRIQAAMGVVGDALITVAAFVVLWRLWLGFGEKFPFGSDALRDALNFGSKPYFAETTYELQLPIWIPFGLSLIGAATFFIVSAYTVWRSVNWVLAGQEAQV